MRLPHWLLACALAAAFAWAPATRPEEAHAAVPGSVSASGSTITFTVGDATFNLIYVLLDGANYRFVIGGGQALTAGSGCAQFDTATVDCPHASIDTVHLDIAAATFGNTVNLQGSVSGDTFNVVGGGGADVVNLGTGNLTGFAAVDFIGGGNSDTLNLIDSVVATSQVWSLISGLTRRSGFGGATNSTVETVEIRGGQGADTFNVGSTRPGITTIIGGNGDDTFAIAAGGLAATGQTRIFGGNPTSATGDTLTVYDGGLTVSDNNTGTITTVGRQPIGYVEIETRSVVPSTDVDGDGCSDVKEGGGPHVLGGERSPLDFWDFYDVTGDVRIDLADALTLLAKFGVDPPGPGEPDNGYIEAQDRVQGPDTRRWLTAKATGDAAGMTLEDVLASLASFGDDCA